MGRILAYATPDKRKTFFLCLGEDAATRKLVESLFYCCLPSPQYANPHWIMMRRIEGSIKDPV